MSRSKSHFSSELIKASGEFAVNIPFWDLLDKAVLCGSVSGREKDKFEITGLSPRKAVVLSKTPVIGECAGVLECALISVKDIGDHYVFFGEVLYAEAEEGYFARGCWDTSKAKLISHVGGKCFSVISPSTRSL